MATFALPALAGLLMIMIVIEMGARWAWPTFAVVAILSVFFVPDKQAALLYVIFFGYYPILKALIERLKNKIVQGVFSKGFLYKHEYFRNLNDIDVFKSMLHVFLYVLNS